MNPARSTTLEVVKNSKSVKINLSKIEALAQKWSKQKIIIPNWPHQLHFESKNQEAMLDYLIILDSLNFCFWSKNKKWSISYKGKKYNGYFALSLALKKFFESGSAKANLNYFANVSEKDFSKILNGRGELLLFKKRWTMVRGVSRYILENYGNSPEFIAGGNQKLSALVPKIAGELPYFNDVAYFHNKKIYFWKRAQILAADIYGAFRGCGLGYFKDLDYLTAFADYKIPQIFNHFGILEYSEDLENKIRRQILVKAGSREEIEIRSAAIWAVEYLKKTLRKYGRNFNSFELDWFLWNKGQRLKMKSPYHLTKTIFY